MKLGTATSVLYRYTIQDAVALVARAGFEGIDIWGGRPHVYRQDLSKQELKELRRVIEDHGLCVPSFMPAFYRYPHSLSNPNPKVRQDSIAYMCESIENAVLLGAGIVLVVPDHCLRGQTREDGLSRLIESIDLVARHASQHEDLKLGLEVLYYDETDLINSAEDALYIIRQLKCENVGVVLDTGTMNLSQEPPQETFAKLGNRVLQVHVNDNEGDSRQQNLIPGEGTFDFPGFIQFLKTSRYPGFLSAELSKEYAEDPEPALRTTAERLRSWMRD